MKKLILILLSTLSITSMTVHAGTNASLVIATNTLQVAIPNFWPSNAPAIGSALQAIGFGGGTNGGGTNFFDPSQFVTNTSGQVTISNLPAAKISGTIANSNQPAALATLSSNLNTSLTNVSGQTIEQRVAAATNTIAVGSIVGNLPAAQISGQIATTNLSANLATLSSNLNTLLTNASGQTITAQIANAVATANYISNTNAVVTNLALRQGTTGVPGFTLAAPSESASVTLGFDSFGNLALDPGPGTAAAGFPGILNIGLDAGGGIYPMTINRTNGTLNIGMGFMVDGATGKITGAANNVKHLQATNLEGTIATTNLPSILISNNGPAAISNSLTVTGVLTASNIQSSVITGTNNWTGDLAFPGVTIGSLANGNNAAVPTSTNTYIRIIGPTAPFSINGIAGGRDGRVITLENSSGQSMTIANNSGIDPTPNNRILTTSGADLTSPATPWLLTLIYDGNQSRWVVKSGQQSANVPFVPFNSTNEIWVRSNGSDTNSGTNQFSPLATATNAIVLANRLGGARINLNAGTFFIATNLVISNNIEIAGAGRYQTFLYTTNTNASPDLILQGSNIWIHDCWIGTNIPGGVYAYPIVPNACTNVEIERCVISGNSDGILRVADPFRTTFHNNVFSSSYITVENNIFYSGYDTMGNAVTSPKVDDPCGWTVLNNWFYILGDTGFGGSLQTRGLYWFTTNTASTLEMIGNHFFISNPSTGTVTTGIHISPLGSGGSTIQGTYHFADNYFTLITNTAGTNAVNILANGTGSAPLNIDGVINPSKLSLTGAFLTGDYLPAGGVTSNLVIGTNTLYITNGVIGRIQ